MSNSRFWIKFLLYFGLIGLAISSFLLFPGNPIWDWSKTIVPNAIFIYLSVLSLLAVIFFQRQSILKNISELSLNQRVYLYISALLFPTIFFVLLYIIYPPYLVALAQEWGTVEPLSFLFNACFAIFAFEHSNLLKKYKLNHKPYKLLAILYAIFFFEECDYFGIFGGIIGRINGVYVGTLHDLFHLWFKGENKVLGLVIFLVVSISILIFLVKKRYLTAKFIKREIFTFSSLLIYLAIVIVAIAQLYDVGSDLVKLPKYIYQMTAEEVLEFYFSVLILLATLMKFARDYRSLVIDKKMIENYT